MNQTIAVGVVDSEALVRGGIRRVLEQAPDVRVVAEAASGSGAVELVRKHRPRVLLMDVRMPGLDGLAATEQVRGLSPGTSVVESVVDMFCTPFSLRTETFACAGKVSLLPSRIQKFPYLSV